MPHFSSYLRPALLALLLAAAGTAQAQRAATFDAGAAFSTGTNSTPYSIAVADVNGDGKLDLLTANRGNDTAGVLLGTGTGSFGPFTAFSTGSGSIPYGIAVADVNGDGKPDLLTANRGSNSVGVLLGTGTGSFGLATQFGTGSLSRPQGIVVADVNGDGKLDVLTANYNSSTAAVLLGTGTGSFGTFTAFNTGGGIPYALAVADVNGDGKPDLLVLNTTNSTVGVLLGTGTGSFGTATTFFTGNTGSPVPIALAVADVNGDGKLDVLAANNGSDTAALLLGTGTGSFGSFTQFSTGGRYPTAVAVADVNGDSKPDLLVTNYSDAAAVLLGTGTGSFGPATQFGTGSGSQPYALAVADVNGDGKPDLLTANSGGSTAGVLLNTTPGLVTSTLGPASTPSAGLALFPNPAPHGAAKLTRVTPGQVVQVLDAVGRVASTATADATGTVTLGGLTPGLYLVRLGSGSMRLAAE